jgi:hypothetical protein
LWQTFISRSWSSYHRLKLRPEDDLYWVGWSVVRTGVGRGRGSFRYGLSQTDWS